MRLAAEVADDPRFAVDLHNALNRLQSQKCSKTLKDGACNLVGAINRYGKSPCSAAAVRVQHDIKREKGE